MCLATIILRSAEDMHMCPYVEYTLAKSPAFTHKRYVEDNGGIMAEIKTIALLKEDVITTQHARHIVEAMA